jgi:Ca2+-binding EF-hand superfamily protein
MLQLIYSMMDPQKKTSRISYETLKFYLASSSYSSHIAVSLDFDPTLERASLSAETSNEELNMCKSGARKILSASQNNLNDLLTKHDKHGEGMISREDVVGVFTGLNIKDLSKAEVKMLMNYLDKGSRGYVSINNVCEKLQELSTETKEDVMLRRFGTTIKHQGINLLAELQRFDISKNGTMDKKAFSRAMKQLALALTDDEIDYLFSAGELAEM